MRPILLLSLIALVPLPRSADARQTVGSTTGTISGVVSDNTGAVLPGVTIEISGAALMGARTIVTNGEGFYRFPVLPPGEYTLVFTLEGFGPVNRDGVYVGVGLTRTVNVVLSVATLNQSVTVEPTSSTIDAQSTAIAANFDARQLANLPGARNMLAVLAATPALQMTRFDVGGNTAAPGGGSGFSAYGTFGQNRPMVEGIVAAGVQVNGFSFNYGAFDEITVGTAAHSAEWPAPGVNLQFVSKSGGNQYRGTLYADYENERLQSFNIDQEQISRGARAGGGLAVRDTNRLWSYHDLNADVGGYIRRDTIWWYSSIRDQDIAARFVNFPVKPHQTRLTSYSGKGTYRVTPNHTLVAFGQLGRNHQPNRLDGFTIPATSALNVSEESTTDELATGWVWKGEWNAVIGNTVFFEVRAGSFGTTRSDKSRNAADRFEDSETKIVRGGNRDWEQHLRRPQLLASLSYFKDGWFGHHQFKLGGEAVRTTNADIWKRGYARDVLHILTGDAPKEVYLFQTPSRSENGLWANAAFVTDSWRLNNRLTLNLGLRLDRYRAFLPEQQHLTQTFAAVDNLIDWTAIAPRIGAIHDLTGDGRTLLKLSYGHYWLPPGDLGANVNPNSNDWWINYSWSDLNTNGAWDPGEQVGTPRRRRGGVAIESLDPGLKLPYMLEVAGWVERELPADVGIRTGVVWRSERQQYTRQNKSQPFDAFTIATVVPDPGPDGRRGTSDDGPDLRAYNLVAAGPQENIVRNVPGVEGHFWTWEFTATRRFSKRWSLVTGFAQTWNRDQRNAYFGQTLRQNMYPLTPNDLINAGDDGRYEFATWSAKVHGTYEAPWGVRLTPLLRHQSGQPFGRTVAASLNYATVPILAEPVGTRRMDNITILDARVEKGFRLSGGRRVAGFLDVFNLLNANPVANAIWSSEAFLQPISILPPRIVRIGAKLEW
jgi:carboxypeptidase family protein/TonB-dependent receptor-like protein